MQKVTTALVATNPVQIDTSIAATDTIDYVATNTGTENALTTATTSVATTTSP